ncbi:MAG: hypothetical protein HY904_13490 [Deltaproteobacteria bacterium]|nr:hypothetical protein [Deltaproteobacteria bacterium]
MGRHLQHALVTALVLAALPACVNVRKRTETTNETKLYGDYAAAGLGQGTYVYMVTGLTGSAAANPGDEDAMSSLGTRAMDALVARARLKRNQALVNVTVERGMAYLGNRTKYVVTVRGDVIEFVNNLPNPPDPEQLRKGAAPEDDNGADAGGRKKKKKNAEED